MATYSIYGNQYGATPPAKKAPAATDIFTNPVSPTAVSQGAQPNQSNAVTGAAVPNPFPTNPVTNPFGPVAPAANPGSFETLLNNAGPARTQNIGAAQKTISDQLMPAPGPSRESAAVRSSFIKAQEEAGRKNSEASSLSGRLSTGQLPGDIANFNRESLGQRADLENKLAISDATRNDAQRQLGVSNVLGMEHLASGERVADKGIISNEKLKFADLSQDDKHLAQAGSQFDQKLDFDKWAKGQDMNEADRDRIWKSIENEKGRVFTSSESALDRTLNSSQFSETMGLSKQQFAETIRQFNGKMDFDKWAKNSDLDEHTKDQIWKANQDDITRKWQTGERLGTQEHEVLLEKLKGDIDINKINRNHVLNLDTQEKQNAQDEKILALQNTYQTIRDEKGYSHEAAMAEIEGKIKSDLLAQGYTQDQALQGAKLEAERINTNRNIESEERIAIAELASRSDIALQELGIKKETLDITRKQIESEIEIGKFKLTDAKMRTAIDTASVLLEKWGDNPDTQIKAAEILYGGLRDSGQLGEGQKGRDAYDLGVMNAKASGFKDEASFRAWAQGQGTDQKIVDKIVQGKNGTWAGTGSNANGGTGDSLQGALDKVDDVIGKLPASVNGDGVKAELTAAAKGGKNKTETLALDDLPGAMANVWNNQGVKDFQYMNPTKEAFDYLGFHNLVKMGVPEKTAGDLLSQTLGADRFKKSYKALTGKDWNG